MIRNLWNRFMAWLACGMTIAEWEALQDAKEGARAFQENWRKTADFSEPRATFMGQDDFIDFCFPECADLVKPAPKEPPIMFLDV